MYCKYLKKIFTAILCIGLFCNCRKYRDDDGISFRSPFNRIVGNWYIDCFLVNYQDSSLHTYTTNTLMASRYFLKNLQLYFSPEPEFYGGYYIVDGPNNAIGVFNPNNRTSAGSWELDASRQEIQIRGFDFEYRVPTLQKWRILKLTSKEFHVQTNFNANSYEIYFKKY